MPGYAIEPTALAGESGSLGTSTTRLISDDTSYVLLEALAKTKLISVLVTNNSGGILPVDLLVLEDGATEPTYLAKGFRVHKRRYALQALVSGDTRVDQPVVGESLTLTEVVLNTGDSILAKCPVGGAIDVTVTYLQGVN